MEPKLSSPNPSPEVGGGHRQAELPQMPAEVISPAPERASMPEASPVSSPPPVISSSIPSAQPPVLPVPQPAPITPQDPIRNDNPLVAGDEEVLEKEWVDRAKKIVAQTKDDPYSQEKEVSKLQADYLKKRYGKEVKLADE